MLAMFGNMSAVYCGLSQKNLKAELEKVEQATARYSKAHY